MIAMCNKVDGMLAASSSVQAPQALLSGLADTAQNQDHLD